jgi:hypothetical protein
MLAFFVACVYSPFLSHFSPKRERDGLFPKRIRVTFLGTVENPPGPLFKGEYAFPVLKGDFRASGVRSVAVIVNHVRRKEFKT